MKTFTIIFTFIALPILGLAINDHSKSILNEDKDKTLCLKTVHNAKLQNQLEENFIALFDEILYINAEFSNNTGYYYAVYGKKNDIYVTHNLKVGKNDIENETYTHIDFSKINLKETVEFCYENKLCPCEVDPLCFTAPLVICGIWDGFNCTF